MRNLPEEVAQEVRRQVERLSRRSRRAGGLVREQVPVPHLHPSSVGRRGSWRTGLGRRRSIRSRGVRTRRGQNVDDADVILPATAERGAKYGHPERVERCCSLSRLRGIDTGSPMKQLCNYSAIAPRVAVVFAGSRALLGSRSEADGREARTSTRAGRQAIRGRRA